MMPLPAAPLYSSVITSSKNCETAIISTITYDILNQNTGVGIHLFSPDSEMSGSYNVK